MLFFYKFKLYNYIKVFEIIDINHFSLENEN